MLYDQGLYRTVLSSSFHDVGCLRLLYRTIMMTMAARRTMVMQTPRAALPPAVISYPAAALAGFWVVSPADDVRARVDAVVAVIGD